MEKLNYKVYIFSDSIGFGQLVSPSETWANDLSDKLINLKKSYDILLQNPSVNGCTTRQALERLYFDCTSHKPDLVIIQFGLNDCNFWDTDYGLPRVSPNSFIENLNEIIIRIYASGAKKCFINTNHPTSKGLITKLRNINYEQKNKEYNNYIREVHTNLHKKFNLEIIDIENYWNKHITENSNLNSNNLLLPDGIHLSIRGHNLYKNIINKRIINYIEENLD